MAAATAEYLRDEDALTTWIDEACERRADHWTGTSELFAAWRAWATRNGEFPGRVRKFVTDLEARGFRMHRQKIGRGIIGLRLLDPHEVEEDEGPTPYDHDTYDGA